MFFSGFFCLELRLGLGKTLQNGDQKQAHKGRGEAAIVQAVAAVEQGDGGDQGIVHHGREEAVFPAVFPGDGAEAVGIAQADHNGLGIDGPGEAAADGVGKALEQPGGCRIAQHNGQYAQRVGAGIAAGQHTEDDAEGHAVEAAANQIVIAQDEQTVYAYVHQESRFPVGRGEAGGLRLVQHQVPVVLRLAAHAQGSDHQNAEHGDAECIHRQPGGDLQRFSGRGGGQIDAHGLIQHRLQEEGGHAHGQGGAVQVVALVHLGGMGQPGGQEEPDGHAHGQTQRHAGKPEAHGLGVGVAHHQLRDQRGKAGGKQHGIHVAAQLLPLDQAVQDDAQDAGPHVQHIDAPGGEAHRQQKGQGGHVVGRSAQQHVQRQAQQGDQTHIQEGGGVAAHGEIVGGDLAGLADDAPQAGEHPGAVGHHQRRDQKCRRKIAEKDF